MPKHYIDEEWDRDALFSTRNLVTVEFAAEHLKVSLHAVGEGRRPRAGGAVVWVFGGRGQTMRKYREVYVDMGPASGPDAAHAWQASTPEALLGEVAPGVRRGGRSAAATVIGEVVERG